MQHRAYQPILPCGNKYLQKKWDKTCFDMHRRKVISAKPTISTKSPQTYGHLNLKMKKLKLEEERISKIERDNNILLEKISNIMRTTGRIDNRNDYENKSLGREQRQRGVLRVTMENQAMFERLSQCVSQYSVEHWHEEWLRSQRYKESIARYPHGEKGKYKCTKQATESGKEKKAGKTMNLNSQDADNGPKIRAKADVTLNTEKENAKTTDHINE